MIILLYHLTKIYINNDEKLNKIILVKKLEIGIEKIIDIKKLKNNKYFAHTKNDLLIINN